uniref:Crinkler effector protein N-terminal domain-containing protein n=1 Tax=Globisporangium ultimum (strain ATCC 200006 / CBS 805.95 / DAOM BR144) TaxID=431595 RepID=K3XC27_GLOUD
MLTLFCGIVGETESVFYVQCEETDFALSLNKKIKEENPNTLAKCDAILIKLYLTKQDGNPDGKWLAYKEGEDLLAALSKADASSDALRAKHLNSTLAMNRGSTLQDYFSGEHALKHNELHVLVEVPAGSLATGGYDAERRLSSIEEKLDAVYGKVVVNERKRYRHSGMTSMIGQSIIQQLGVTLFRRQWRSSTAHAPIEEFSWKSQYEVQMKDAYKDYLRHHLQDVLEKEHLCVHGDENGSNVLNAAIPGHSIDFTGRTDLLILDKDVEEFDEDASDLPGVRMAIEVKTDEEKCKKHSFQAISGLITLDVLAPTPVVVLLTNLTNYWRFYWVKENTVQNVILRQPSSAFQLIRATLPIGYSAPQIEDVIELEGLHVARKKLIIQPSGVEGEGPSAEGIRESIERYHDIASILGPDITMDHYGARDWPTSGSINATLQLDPIAHIPTMVSIYLD